MTTTPDIDLDKYLRIINLRVYLALELLRKHGSEAQVDRYARGAMGVDELLTIARSVLFEPFAGIDVKRFGKATELMRMHRQLKHADRCPESGRDDAELNQVTVTENENRTIRLDPHQQRNLDLLRAAVTKASAHEWLDVKYMLDRTGTTEPIAMDVTMHLVSCKVCQRDLHVVSAKVSIRWCEHTLVREWLL